MLKQLNIFVHYLDVQENDALDSRTVRSNTNLITSLYAGRNILVEPLN